MKEKLEKETVLDPMIGSGTTGIAAYKLNRKFIGIEKDSETFGMARARIKNFCYLVIIKTYYLNYR